MIKCIFGTFLLFGIIFFCSCNQFVYRPHSAKQKRLARPHVQFMMAVVKFRENYGVWPPYLTELEAKYPENKKIMENFQYQTVTFEIKDIDRLTVFFYDYKLKPYWPDNNDKTDLNAFNGRINFYKSKGKFVWKVKMR